MAGAPEAHDAPVWDVLAVRYGTRVTRKSECYLDFASHGEPDAAVGMDYFFYVLRDGERTVLVDTGFDPTVGERRGRTTVCPPVEALALLGIRPEEVSLIVVTHLHYDHIGNLAAFPEAELAVHERELAFRLGPDGLRPEHAAVVEADEIAHVVEARAEGRVRVLTGSGPIAPGIDSVCVGGHSPGQLVLVVEGRRGPVVLASDAVHYYEELERRWPFAIVVDVDEMVAGYETVERLAGERGASVVPGHDPLVLDRFPPFADAPAELGVRLA
jgi:glyoxylase-like metal-dependent hydrolase (beta-lactamase superfamily II)